LEQNTDAGKLREEFVKAWNANQWYGLAHDLGAIGELAPNGLPLFIAYRRSGEGGMYRVVHFEKKKGLVTLASRSEKLSAKTYEAAKLFRIAELEFRSGE
jgi:hypothetical protein